MTELVFKSNLTNLDIIGAVAAAEQIGYTDAAEKHIKNANTASSVKRLKQAGIGAISALFFGFILYQPFGYFGFLWGVLGGGAIPVAILLFSAMDKRIGAQRGEADPKTAVDRFIRSLLSRGPSDMLEFSDEEVAYGLLAPSVVDSLSVRELTNAWRGVHQNLVDAIASEQASCAECGKASGCLGVGEYRFALVWTYAYLKRVPWAFMRCNECSSVTCSECYRRAIPIIRKDEKRLGRHCRLCGRGENVALFQTTTSEESLSDSTPARALFAFDYNFAPGEVVEEGSSAVVHTVVKVDVYPVQPFVEKSFKEWETLMTPENIHSTVVCHFYTIAIKAAGRWYVLSAFPRNPALS